MNHLAGSRQNLQKMLLESTPPSPAFPKTQKISERLYKAFYPHFLHPQELSSTCYRIADYINENSIPKQSRLILPHHVIIQRLMNNLYHIVIPTKKMIDGKKKFAAKSVKINTKTWESHTLDTILSLSRQDALIRAIPNGIRIEQFYQRECKGKFSFFNLPRAFLSNDKSTIYTEHERPYNTLSSSQLPLKSLLLVFYHVANDLCFLHKHSMVHGNVQPGNIWLYEKVKSKEVLVNLTGFEYAVEAKHATVEGMFEEGNPFPYWDQFARRKLFLPSTDVYGFITSLAEKVFSKKFDKKTLRNFNTKEEKKAVKQIHKLWVQILKNDQEFYNWSKTKMINGKNFHKTLWKKSSQFQMSMDELRDHMNFLYSSLDKDAV